MPIVDIFTRESLSPSSAETSDLAAALKEAVDKLLTRDDQMESFYLVAEYADGTRVSLDSGLTAADTIVLLQREAFHILCMMEGVKV